MVDSLLYSLSERNYFGINRHSDRQKKKDRQTSYFFLFKIRLIVTPPYISDRNNTMTKNKIYPWNDEKTRTNASIISQQKK